MTDPVPLAGLSRAHLGKDERTCWALRLWHEKKGGREPRHVPWVLSKAGIPLHLAANATHYLGDGDTGGLDMLQERLGERAHATVTV